MKIRQEDNLILTNGTNEKKFTIQASAKAFQILSSALYSRKIEAIIRELSCNAHDSHISAGYGELPFEVHLPNQWEPEFYVEDYGIGLDAEDIENIYTSYFTSTKTDTNDLTGGFGLGSKTPFSYTDSFNIRTRKDGVEYHFNAYINMGGEPSVSLLSMAPTTERNGVRVAVPVKSTDYDQFASDAVKVYNWFPTTPTVVGREISINNAKALRLQAEGYFWSEYQKDGWERNTISAVMGNVVYHVPKVSETFSGRLDLAERKFFENNSLYLKFKIGDLDVNAGRESLSFDEDTEDVFVARIKEVIAEYCVETQRELDTNITNIPDALALIESSVGQWARSLFTYDGINANDLASKNFLKTLRECFEVDNYYFARNNRGQIKRHTLDYTHHMTFPSLNTRRIIVMQGNDMGYQRIAKEIADVSHTQQYGVFFTEKLVTDEEKDEVYRVFGDYVEFVVAADLVAADKAARKAAREAAKLAGGPTVRAPSKPRIGSDSVRAHIYEVVVDANGSINGIDKQNVITTVASLEGKNYLMVEERYGRCTLQLTHEVTGVVADVSISTVSESEMYSICVFFKIDMLVMVKTESYNKAVKLFADGAMKDVGAINTDVVQRLRTRDHTGIYNEEARVESLVYRSINLYYGVLKDLVVEAVEAHVVSEPNGDIANCINDSTALSTSLNFNFLPYTFRDLVDEPAAHDIANSIKRTIEAIYHDIVERYPMINRNEDNHDSELVQYIADMDELKEFRLQQQIAVQEV